MAVSSDVDAEVRRVTLTNSSDRVCKLEVTSYAEIALNPRRADQAHPAFAKLFLETEYHAASGALLCRRRPRTHDQPPIWALHTLASKVAHEVEYETDRARFLGRGRSTRNPAGLDIGAVLRERWDRCWTLCLACASVFRLSLERRRPWRSQPPRRKIGVRP